MVGEPWEELESGQILLKIWLDREVSGKKVKNKFLKKKEARGPGIEKKNPGRFFLKGPVLIVGYEGHHWTKLKNLNLPKVS